MINPPSIDKQLSLFSTAVENSGVPCHITLFVHGIIVSGSLSSWRLRFQSLSKVAESATSQEIEAVKEAIAPDAPGRTVDHEGGVPIDGRDDVYMQNATVYLPNGKVASFEWWQCRLYSVDAFALGLVN